MAHDDEEVCDKDDRTIFVRGFNEKITEKLLFELFFQAGPVERVAIPKDSDGNLKTFGFVTYKHLASVSYAMNILSGTKLFGREILMKNRKADQQQPQFSAQSHASLLHGYNAPYNNPVGDLSPNIQNQQQLIQQQLVLMATGQNLANFANYGAQMFAGSSSLDQFASTRQDSSGSHREHYVDRHRHHREDNRSSRSNPYRRSRSRSPNHQQNYRSRDRSPKNQRRSNDRGRNDDRSNYHRWGKR